MKNKYPIHETRIMASSMEEAVGQMERNTTCFSRFSTNIFYTKRASLGTRIRRQTNSLTNNGQGLLIVCMDRLCSSKLILCALGLVSSVGIFLPAWPCEGKTQVTVLKAQVDFNRDIRPILSENCYACHGPDKNKRKAGLRLDQPEDALAKLESGDFAIVAGNVSKSKLLALVVAEDEDERMPPPKTGKRLSKEQVELLRQWIEQGAKWKSHWAYIPPDRPPLPPVKDRQWPQNEIDRFILARLEQENLKPSPEAEKPTLIRRVTVDLTGLPPTISEVDAFLSDKSPQAYEKLVDRLLTSPHFGERMAQQWLDLARYADSDGYHADAPRSMWQYRDWVINAFNDNKPFDQFTVEQIAGDLLPKPTLEQKIATAFNRNGMSSTEGGADPDEYMAKYVTDRVNTTSTVWLGSTIGCCECHDHKYDPFTQKEYYELFDFFNRIPEKGLDSDPAPPFVKVPTKDQSDELARLTAQISPLDAQRKTRLDEPNADLDSAQSTWEQAIRKRTMLDWTVLEPLEFSSTNGATLTKLEDKSVLASGTNVDKDVYEITLRTSLQDITGLRLEALTDDSLPSRRSGRGQDGNFILTGFEAEAESATPAQETTETPELGSWYALGPFKAANANEAFSKAFIPENEIDPAKTYDEGKLRWTEKPEWKDGTVQKLTGETSATYLYRTIKVKTARPMVISLGSDDGIQVWLNGKKLLANNVSRSVAPDQEKVLLRLAPGENKLLLKVNNGGGDYAFYFSPQAGPVTKYPVEFASAAADFSRKDFPVRGALDAKVDTGWSVNGNDETNRANHQAVFIASQPLGFAGGTLLKVRLKFESAFKQQTLGRFRLAVTTSDGWKDFGALPQEVQSGLFAENNGRNEGQKTQLRNYFRENNSPEIKELNQKLAGLRKTESELNAKIPTLRIMEDMPEPRTTQILVRGDYRNRGERVTAGVPKALPPLPADSKTNRLSLAQWLVDPQQPLVSRVTVNRYWQLYFGTGLVKTGNEFGTQGELPSHPELLDWLAREFIDSGWNIKAMQKKIVMSATYRQSSKATPEILAKDPYNRLLARGPRFRMPAEVIRDNALAYSGLLDRGRKPGGPSVRPYQPEGLWEDMMFGGNKYVVGKGDELYRRSIYTLWKRTVPYPTFKTFDAPDRAICTEQRGMTCTPLQAFVTLNEKTFVEAARVFAQRIIQEGGGEVQARLDFAFKTVLARPPSEKERKIMTGIYEEMLANYQKDLKSALELISVGESKRPADINELQLVAWTTVANVLFNLDETVTKE